MRDNFDYVPTHRVVLLYEAGNDLLVFLDVLIVIAAIWVMLESASALMSARRDNAAPVAAVVD